MLIEGDTALLLAGFVVLLLLFLEGFFSGSEIAFLSLPPVKVKEDQRILFFLNNTEKLLATTLLGTNLCVITNSAFVTYILKKKYALDGEIYTVLILSPLVLLLGETIPKTLAKNRPESFSKKVIPVFSVVYKIFSPVSLFFIQLLKLLGQEGLSKELIVSREELPEIIEAEKNTDIKQREKELIQAILNLRHIRAKEVMKPIIQVRTLEKSHSVKNAVEIASQTGYTRFPVYEEHIYNIKGILNVFDLIDAPLESEISPFVKAASFVPETETVWNILKEMQDSHTPLVIVVDEYGAATGLITIEDILEELVGEIADEYDLFSSPQEKIVEESDGSYLVLGDAPVDLVEERLKLGLPKREAYETLAGLVMYLLDRMPKKGDKVSVGNCDLIVEDADERHIKKIRVKPWRAA